MKNHLPNKIKILLLIVFVEVLLIAFSLITKKFEILFLVVFLDILALPVYILAIQIYRLFKNGSVEKKIFDKISKM